MPRTRPREISNGVSLTDKLRRERRPLIPEQAAFDPALPVLPVSGKPPNKHGVAGIGSENDALPWARELALFRRTVFSAAVVPAVEREAGAVAVTREEPKG
jgi:hypothetical protein